MNKHNKIALYVAPFLIIGGYVLTDFYLIEEAAEQRVYELKSDGNCDVLNKSCILSAGDFKVSVYDQDGTTFINGTHPLSSAVLFVLNQDDEGSVYKMTMDNNSLYYWKAETKINDLLHSIPSVKLRIIVEMNGDEYYQEFSTSK